MNKIAIFLADGFEEIEGLTVVDIVRRAGIDIDTISINGRLEVNGSHGIQVKADKILADINKDEYTMLVLPGGKVGTENLEACDELIDMIGNFYGAGKYIAAICAAPMILGEKGLLSGKSAVCFPGFEENLKGADIGNSSTAVCENYITSKGAGTAYEFGAEIIDYISGIKGEGRKIMVQMQCKIR